MTPAARRGQHAGRGKPGRPVPGHGVGDCARARVFALIWTAWRRRPSIGGAATLTSAVSGARICRLHREQNCGRRQDPGSLRHRLPPAGRQPDGSWQVI